MKRQLLEIEASKNSKKQRVQDNNIGSENFSLIDFPQNIKLEIFSYLSFKELGLFHKVGRLGVKPTNYNIFWRKVKLKILQRDFSRHNFLINIFNKENIDINQLIRAFIFYGDTVDEKNISIFLKVLNNPEKLLAEDFEYLTKFNVHSPYHSLVTYLRETGEQKILDILAHNYNTKLLNSLKEYHQNPSIVKKSKTHDAAYKIFAVLYDEKELWNKINNDEILIPQLINLAFEHNKPRLLLTALYEMRYLIELNQQEAFTNSMESLLQRLKNLNIIKKIENNENQKEIFCFSLAENFDIDVRDLISVYEELTFACSQFNQNDFYNFSTLKEKISFQPTMFCNLNYIAWHIIHGNVNYLEKTLQSFTKEKRKLEKYDLPLYTAFTKRNFSEVVATLKKYNIQLDENKRYQIITPSLKLALAYDENIEPILAFQSTFLYSWAIVGQNTSLINKLDFRNIQKESFYINNLLTDVISSRAWTLIPHIKSQIKIEKLSLINSIFYDNFATVLQNIQDANSSEIQNVFYTLSNNSYNKNQFFQTDYRYLVHLPPCSHITFLLLAKLNDYSFIDSSPIYKIAKISIVLAANPAINDQEKSFIIFMLQYSSALFLAINYKQKLFSVLKLLKQDSACGNIGNESHYLSSNVKNCEDIKEFRFELMTHMGSLKNEDLIKKLKFFLLFIELESKLLPLLRTENSINMLP